MVSNTQLPKLSGTRRVGLYGGTFDPPHIGLLVGASEAAAACGLDEVVFMVAGHPWQKDDPALTPAEHRYAMAVLATEARADFSVSRLEIDREGPSYTADTLEHLAAELAPTQLVFIAGADALAEIDTWERAADVKRLSSFAVLRRAGTSTERVREALRGAEVTDVDMPLVDVSSTDIRERVAAGRPISFLVPEAVDRYIVEHALYSPLSERRFLS